MGIDILINIIFYKEEDKNIHEIGMTNLLSLCSHFIASESSTSNNNNSNNNNISIINKISNNNHGAPVFCSISNSKKWILDIAFQKNTFDQTNIPQFLVLHNLLRYVDLEEGIYYIQTYNLVQRIVQD